MRADLAAASGACREAAEQNRKKPPARWHNNTGLRACNRFTLCRRENARRANPEAVTTATVERPLCEGNRKAFAHYEYFAF